MNRFQLTSEFQPAGDQPRAIEALAEGVLRGDPHQVLLGVTGSGKTFTVARVIQAVQRPALIMAHNKTLAAQLYGEFKSLFPDNAVHYFVSYYDYYQPEAYLPSTDTYIEKDSSINEEIDKLRHAATHALFERNDVIIVASVSCIYGLGSPEAYSGMQVNVAEGLEIHRDDLLREAPRIRRIRGPLLAAGAYDVHLLARDAVMLRPLVRALAHMHVLEGVPQPVVDHAVHEYSIAHTVSQARLGDEVGRVGHGFLSAHDQYLRLVQLYHLVRHLQGGHGGDAYLVYVNAPFLLGDAALDGRLARRYLALPPRDHLSHDHAVDDVGVDACPLDGLGYGYAAQVLGGKVLERSRQPAKRGPR